MGLKFSCSFRRAVFADEAILLELLVVGVAPIQEFNGKYVDLTGRTTSQDRRTALEATARVLVTASPRE